MWVGGRSVSVCGAVVLRLWMLSWVFGVWGK